MIRKGLLSTEYSSMRLNTTMTIYVIAAWAVYFVMVFLLSTNQSPDYTRCAGYSLTDVDGEERLEDLEESLVVDLAVLVVNER